MSNDNKAISFADSGNALTSLDDLSTSLSTVAVMGSGMSGLPFLRMDRHSGAFIYGQESIEVEEDSLWAVNPHSVQVGLICWGDARNVLGEVMVKAGQPVPQAADQIDHGFAWAGQLQIDMTCLDGTDEGVTVRFKTTSLGGKRAITTLAGLIGQRAAAGNPAVVPVIDLKHESYDHKSFGKINNPIFDIEKWVSMEGDDEAGTLPKAEPTEEKESKPKRRTRRTA